MPPSASTMEGNNIVWMFDQKSWVSGTYEAGPGKTCQCTAKMSTRTGAMTKGGSARKAKVVLLEAWSKRWLGLRADFMAMGKAMAKAMICERMISSRSMGNDWAMMLVVDWWVV